ncbi:hypothetical protein FBU30_009125 [Linnemannia zychae]|nr:hypothetical protein FBU30_009125 [Linnemannia zychae]
MTGPSLVSACCNTPATNAEWTNKGYEKVLATKVNGEERKVYRTGPKDAKHGIIGVFDIFGLHPTTYQFFDRLALSNGGFQVSMPHMFKVPPPTEEMLGDMSKIMAYFHANGDYKTSHIDELIRAAVEDLRADGCTSFSIIGLCWGAYIAVKAASDPDMHFLAAGGPHPSMITTEFVQDVKCPLIFLASKDEADLVPVIESLKDKDFAVESYHKRFDNMHHGWCGARGDWSNPDQFKAALEAIGLIGDFCAKVAEVDEKNKL